MVEKITEEAVRRYAENLREKGLISRDLASSLDVVLNDLDRFSSWDEAGGYLKRKGLDQLEAKGPMSKFLRTLAFTLEKLDSLSGMLRENGIRIHTIRLSDTMSGCSDYRGRIEVFGYHDKDGQVCVFSGPFEWDCAVHELPQSRAAQELGYRCMVSFPSARVEGLVSTG